jgi:GH18 family chitinase
MKYKVGDKLRFIGKTLKHSVWWTQNKIYEIKRNVVEYHADYRQIRGYEIIRDDGKNSIWLENEMKGKFISLKKERKKKLKKLCQINKNG